MLVASHGDGQAVGADPVGDRGLQPAGPAGLRKDPHPVGHRVRGLVGQHPGHVAGQPVAGVVPGRLAQRQLLGLPGEGVLAVPDPVRPRDQVLTSAALDHVSSSANPRTTSTAVDRVAAQRRADLGDDGPVAPGDDLVLLAGGAMLTVSDFSGPGLRTYLGPPCRVSQSREPAAPHLSDPHPRLPDERARLRAAGRVCWRRRATAGPTTTVRPTSWCSTPARCGRTPTTGCTAASVICCRPRTRTPGMQIAVGGCLAQKDQQEIVRRAPWVDVVFGTHNIGSLPVLLERARVSHEAQVEIKEALQTFPSNLPTRRDSAYAAWVSISVGCNNTCTFCIVPALRGRETDRRPGDILAEIEALVAEGVQEVTLLGQNVNAYGVEFGDRHAFAKLLRACGQVDGLERVRFTSPHPKDFTDEVIAAMAETPNVMPALHMPLQSGSDRVLRAMRRSYRSERYLGIIDRVRSAMPDAAITTDIIVGFPGRDRAGLPGHPGCGGRRRGSPRRSPSSTRSAPARRPRPCRIRCRSRWSRSATTGWSPWSMRSPGRRTRRPGRPPVEVLFADGEGRKDAATARMSGRARDNRLVHVAVPDDPALRPRPGDFAEIVITYAAPHHLNADAGLISIRRTRGGDAWAARRAPASRPPSPSACPRSGVPPHASLASRRLAVGRWPGGLASSRLRQLRLLQACGSAPWRRSPSPFRSSRPSASIRIGQRCIWLGRAALLLGLAATGQRRDTTQARQTCVVRCSSPHATMPRPPQTRKVVHARRAIRRPAQHPDRPRVRRSPAVRGVRGLLRRLDHAADGRLLLRPGAWRSGATP